MTHSNCLSQSVRLLAFIGAVSGLPCSIVELTHAQAPFFQGKTVTIIQGRDPGGTGDLRTKALVPFLQKYLPGNPTIMMEYMPGAGGRMAANHLFRTAKPDGLTIGNPSIGMISSAIFGETGVQYDIDKFPDKTVGAISSNDKISRASRTKILWDNPTKAFGLGA